LFKKATLFLVIVMIIVSLSGCASITPNMNEINKLDMVRIVGVDIDPKQPNNIRLTILSKKQSPSSQGQSNQSSGGEQPPESEIVSGSAATLFEAERSLQTSSDKQMFWGHADYYLISEKAARRGIGKYIDFLARDHETRGSSSIYIIKKTTAEEFIRKGSMNGPFMPDLLNGIGDNSILVTGPKKLTLLEFMESTNNKNGSSVVPVLYLKPKDGGNPGQKSIDLNGYAVFNNLKLVDFLDKKMTIGENFLLNQVKTGVIEVKDSHKKVVGLEIINSGTKISPYFEKGKLKRIDVKVVFTSNIDEVHSTSNIFTDKDLDFITNEQSKVVKNEIKKVIAFAQEKNTDFVDIAESFETSHPVKWDDYENKWKEIFPTLPINVEVESKINRTYSIREPNGVFEEEHK